MPGFKFSHLSDQEKATELKRRAAELDHKSNLRKLALLTNKNAEATEKALCYLEDLGYSVPTAPQESHP